jgi:methylmalonyl-CoA decarboxylase
MSLVTIELKDAVGCLTLNHAAKRNALSAPLIEDLVSGLEQLREQKARVVLLRAPAGSKVWSAGHDVTELPKNGRDPLAYNDPLRRAVREIERHPTPVVAMIEGTVWGGACEIVIACDFAICGNTTSFAITPAKLGVPYNVSGLLNFLNSVPLPTVKELIFTAAPIPAERALRTGLVNHVVPVPELETFAFSIADQIAKVSPLVVSCMKEELRIISDARPLSPDTFERIQGLRRACYDSEDYQEGIRAFLEKRPAQFTGR